MNSVQEIKDFVNNIDPGKARFKISTLYNSLYLETEDWKAKNDLVAGGTGPLDFYISSNLQRSINKETRKMVVDVDNIINNLNNFIYNTVVEMADETSPVQQPKRTNAYKDMVLVAKLNCREELFINDMLPVINYYYKAKTDSNNNEMDMVVHKNNVQALFNALRKKHGRASSSQR